MEVPVNLLVKNKSLLGVVNIPEHQYEKPIVVIMCYGFNGDRVEQHRLSVKLGRFLAENKVNFCRFDFRNQGLSDGCFDDFLFSEKQQDIDEIVKAIKTWFRRDDIFIYLIGFSNGCKVAIDVAYENTEVNGIILWNPILQELSVNKKDDAGDSRRLYKHPVTGKPYKRFHSLRLNTELLRELNSDRSMSKFKELNKGILCILSKDDRSIHMFIEEVTQLDKKKQMTVRYIENTDHLFGSVESVKHVMDITLEWIIKKATNQSL